MVLTIIAVVFVFGLLVFVHELGHFLTAKAVGMRVDEFAIGFGPKIISRQRGETVYSLRAVPLGGFNKIAGMDPDEEQDEKSFYAKSVGARMFVIVAGSVMNFLLPVILFFAVFMLSGIDTPSQEPVIGSIMQDRPAASAGLLAGDKVVAVDGQGIESWPQFVEIIQKSADKNVVIEVARGGTAQKISVMPEFDATAQRGIIGVTPLVEKYQPGVFEAMGLGAKYTYVVLVKMVDALAEMVTGRAAADIAGPIGIMKMTGEAAQNGLAPLLQFAAFLSINLGLINLLPIPALDGGHIIVLGIEAIRGKQLNKRYLEIVHGIGFVLLILLMIVATFKDITR
ncbi:MAG: RIP metalloprotease RseP [Sporomusaceae bacterium]|nr:RIP metalloprotease RseP [Sporomusaceae bacterium]